MTGYVSIKEEVLQKLNANMPEIRERFGIKTLGIFGSVSRGEDTPESDIDIFYEFNPDRINYDAYLDLYDYLETLFQHKIEMVSLDSMPSRFRTAIDNDMILASIPIEAM